MGSFEKPTHGSLAPLFTDFDENFQLDLERQNNRTIRVHLDTGN